MEKESVKLGALWLAALSVLPTASWATGKYCGPSRHWVRAHHRRAYIREDGTPVSAANVAAHCADNPPGFTFWRPKIINGRPKSWISPERSKNWTEEEIERVLESLSQMPPALQDDSLQGIYRMEKSRDYPNPGSSSLVAIGTYDTAFDKTRQLGRVLSHELAHFLYRRLSASDLETYLEAAYWLQGDRKSKDPGYVLGRSSLLEEDSRISPEEDFANNIEYYLFKPSQLKDLTPRIHAWINNHFGDSFKIGKGR